jgi:hypothetical protein
MKVYRKLPTRKLSASLAFGLMIFEPTMATAETCFNANTLAVHGLAKWSQENCQQQFNISLNYGKLVARFQKGNPDLVVECMNSCRRGESSDRCVKRKIDDIVAGFDRANRQFLGSFCNDPAYR